MVLLCATLVTSVTSQPCCRFFSELTKFIATFVTLQPLGILSKWLNGPALRNPRNFRNLATLLQIFSEFTKFIATFVTLQPLGILSKWLNGPALRNPRNLVTLFQKYFSELKKL